MYDRTLVVTPWRRNPRPKILVTLLMPPKTDTTVDARGLICPEPIMLLHNAVRDAAPGAIIEVIATDPAAPRDIARFCEFLGHVLLDQSIVGEEYFHYVRKRRE